MTKLIDRLGVIGVGLIGGSFAWALKEKGAVGFVIGCGRTVSNLQEALGLGMIDEATTDYEEAVRGADVVLIATPVGEVSGICKKIAHALKSGAVVTDAGSTKAIVQGEMFAHLPPSVQVVAGHPIAGSEKTGATAARADLFHDRYTILTRDKTTDPDALELVKKLWETAGSRVEIMDPGRHDLILGAVSHLPHLVAYALIDTLLEWDRELPMLRFSAGGLKDFTRIAGSSPEMWRDICLDNKDHLLEGIDRYLENLKALREEIASEKRKELTERFARAREVRKRISEGGGR